MFIKSAAINRRTPGSSFWGCVALSFLCLSLSRALAAGEGPYRTVGDVVREASLVAVVDTAPQGYDTLITFREIIKGDPALVGKAFVLPQAYSSRNAYVPQNAKGIVVALVADWDNKKPDPVMEVYQDAVHIEAARTLAKIDQLPTERDQLLAVAGRFNNPNRLYREAALSDFRKMREPGNFPILTGLFNRTDVEGQRSLVTLMKDIGDLRAVPLLIGALDSPDRSVRLGAADALYWTFPGAPGVTAAFRHHLNVSELQITAGKYLAKRDPFLRTASYLQEGKFSRAERLGREGDAAGAKTLWLQIVEDPT
ncbi:MAG: HEAT repeat domain-containing protein, partial [Armatimonadota bacterium]|nr:HEAT repeat domain-containing protein [Armatimonadota bacterium]